LAPTSRNPPPTPELRADITVDITAPGGVFSPAAPANAQEITTTFTANIGSNILQCDGAAPFVPGDTGKYFMINGPGNQNGSWHYGTITYVDANHVTMSTNALKNVAAASCYMAWGNDDGPAFRAFHVWAQTQV